MVLNIVAAGTTYKEFKSDDEIYAVRENILKEAKYVSQFLINISPIKLDL